MPAADGLPLVLRALDDVESASRSLRGAAATSWSSEAADRFRTALDEAQCCVHGVLVAVERTVQPVAAADLGAGGPLEELAFTCRLLEGAADRLDSASWALARA